MSMLHYLFKVMMKGLLIITIFLSIQYAQSFQLSKEAFTQDEFLGIIKIQNGEFESSISDSNLNSICQAIPKLKDYYEKLKEFSSDSEKKEKIKVYISEGIQKDEAFVQEFEDLEKKVQSLLVKLNDIPTAGRLDFSEEQNKLKLLVQQLNNLNSSLANDDQSIFINKNLEILNQLLVTLKSDDNEQKKIDLINLSQRLSNLWNDDKNKEMRNEFNKIIKKIQDDFFENFKNNLLQSFSSPESQEVQNQFLELIKKNIGILKNFGLKDDDFEAIKSCLKKENVAAQEENALNVLLVRVKPCLEEKIPIKPVVEYQKQVIQISKQYVADLSLDSEKLNQKIKNFENAENQCQQQNRQQIRTVTPSAVTREGVESVAPSSILILGDSHVGGPIGQEYELFLKSQYPQSQVTRLSHVGWSPKIPHKYLSKVTNQPQIVSYFFGENIFGGCHYRRKINADPDQHRVVKKNIDKEIEAFKQLKNRFQSASCQIFITDLAHKDCSYPEELWNEFKQKIQNTFPECSYKDLNVFTEITGNEKNRRELYAGRRKAQDGQAIKDYIHLQELNDLGKRKAKEIFQSLYHAENQADTNPKTPSSKSADLRDSPLQPCQDCVTSTDTVVRGRESLIMQARIPQIYSTLDYQKIYGRVKVKGRDKLSCQVESIPITGEDLKNLAAMLTYEAGSQNSNEHYEMLIWTIVNRKRHLFCNSNSLSQLIKNFSTPFMKRVPGNKKDEIDNRSWESYPENIRMIVSKWIQGGVPNRYPDHIDWHAASLNPNNRYTRNYDHSRNLEIGHWQNSSKEEPDQSVRYKNRFFAKAQNRRYSSQDLLSLENPRSDRDEN